MDRCLSLSLTTWCIIALHYTILRSVCCFTLCHVLLFMPFLYYLISHPIFLYSHPSPLLSSPVVFSPLLFPRFLSPHFLSSSLVSSLYLIIWFLFFSAYLSSLVSYFFTYPSAPRIRGRVYRRRYHCQITRNYWSKNSNDYQFWLHVLLCYTTLYDTIYLKLYHTSKVIIIWNFDDILTYDVSIWCYFDQDIAMNKALKITSDII